jgi:hypothetical protein
MVLSSSASPAISAMGAIKLVLMAYLNLKALALRANGALLVREPGHLSYGRN